MGIEKSTRRESDTLIFQSQEHAADFTEHVENRIQQESKPGISSGREVVSQELVKQFESAGHGVTVLSHPWEHSKEEHAEAQQLVNIAFSKDLATAIVQAEKSPTFPRNIDLFHDVLTGEMYDTIVRTRVNSQRIPPLVIGMIALFFALFFGAILVFVFSI